MPERVDPVDLSEQASDAIRLRRASLCALVAWPAFGLTDWFLAGYVEPGRLWVYLLLRAIGFALLVPVALRLHLRPRPSPNALVALDTAATTALSILISISCMEFRGIESPLALGIVTLLVARAALLGGPWRREIVPVGLTALAHPTVLLVLAAFVPNVRAQLHDQSALAAFTLNQMFVLGAAALTLVGGHSVWLLRRQVFQARSLGRYRLVSRIGRGAMGEVWRAHHAALKRDVAIKILRREKEADPLAVARFEREARATSELTHPNTIRVFDYGVTEDGLFYYAMELLDGQDLATILKREGTVSPPRAIELVLQASRALAEAHARGIVHRDIKPENLYVTSPAGQGEFVKVLDFGLARVCAEEGSEPQLTRAGWAVGTPTYIAPEIVLGESADARSDVYALGTVLYELLCGLPPFGPGDIRTVLRARVKDRPAPPSAKLGAPLPFDLERVVMRCLERDPGRRYGSAAELARALAATRSGSGIRRVQESDEVTVLADRHRARG